MICTSLIECGMMNVNSQGQRRIHLQKLCFFWKPSKLDLTSFLLVKYVANFTGDFIKKKEPLNLEGENRNVGFL